MKKKILRLEGRLCKRSEEVQSWNVAMKLMKLLEISFGDTSGLGPSGIQGKILNKGINGAELGALTYSKRRAVLVKQDYILETLAPLAYPIRNSEQENGNSW